MKIVSAIFIFSYMFFPLLKSIQFMLYSWNLKNTLSIHNIFKWVFYFHLQKNVMSSFQQKKQRKPNKIKHDYINVTFAIISPEKIWCSLLPY